MSNVPLSDSFTAKIVLPVKLLALYVSLSLRTIPFESYSSNLIDIKPENYYTHNLLLKSSKPEVKPLNIMIGNSVLADIINCFDQLGLSNFFLKNPVAIHNL